MSDQLVFTDAEFEELVRDRGGDAEKRIPGIAVALEAAASPLLRAVVTRVTNQGVRTHRVWVGPEANTVLAAVGEGRSQLIVTTPQFLAANLARLLGLGPRMAELVGDPPTLDVDDLADLASECFDAASLEQIDAEAIWLLRADWPGGELVTAVVDRADGFWELRPRDSELVGVHRTSTDIWLVLSGLLLRVDA